MERLLLVGKDKRFPQDVWCLTLDDEEICLVDPEGIVQARFIRSDAEARFVLPSFWKDIQHLGIVSDQREMVGLKDGTTFESEIPKVIWFVPDDKSSNSIKAYLLNALASKGPTAVDAVVE